jgi:hypothetical protein
VGVLVLLVLCAPVAVVLALTRQRQAVRKARAATVDLRSDETGVWRELADGRREGVRWDEVREVAVLRTSKGPHGASGGVVILYGDATHGCLVPLDQVASSGIVGQLPRLPSFDSRRLVDALQAADGTHEVWVHPSGGFARGDPPAGGAADGATR